MRKATTEELLERIAELQDLIRNYEAALERSEEENKYLRELLADALPHIECKDYNQSAIITAIEQVCKAS